MVCKNDIFKETRETIICQYFEKAWIMIVIILWTILDNLYNSIFNKLDQLSPIIEIYGYQHAMKRGQYQK